MYMYAEAGTVVQSQPKCENIDHWELLHVSADYRQAGRNIYDYYVVTITVHELSIRTNTNTYVHVHHMYDYRLTPPSSVSAWWRHERMRTLRRQSHTYILS